MKFLITGKAGLIGKKLVSFLIRNNNEISILKRNRKKINGIEDLESISKDQHFNAIINLAGASIS
jgi:NAD dependent epimerase/dehydratase family enzyme